MLTKKDYIKLAGILKENIFHYEDKLLNDLIKWLKEDNSLFNEVKFKEAILKHT